MRIVIQFPGADGDDGDDGDKCVFFDGDDGDPYFRFISVQNNVCFVSLSASQFT